MLQGDFQYGEDNGLPAGHESLKCLSSAMPRWVGDAHWDNKVRRRFQGLGGGRGWEGHGGRMDWGRAMGGEWLSLRYSVAAA